MSPAVSLMLPISYFSFCLEADLNTNHKMLCYLPCPLYIGHICSLKINFCYGIVSCPISILFSSTTTSCKRPNRQNTNTCCFWDTFSNYILLYTVLVPKSFSFESHIEHLLILLLGGSIIRKGAPSTMQENKIILSIDHRFYWTLSKLRFAWNSFL